MRCVRKTRWQNDYLATGKYPRMKMYRCHMLKFQVLDAGGGGGAGAQTATFITLIHVFYLFFSSLEQYATFNLAASIDSNDVRGFVRCDDCQVHTRIITLFMVCVCSAEGF